MDVLGVIFNALDGIMNPVVSLDPNPQNPLITVFLISTLIAVITTVANKVLVDQDKMDSLRDEMKVFQEKLREAQKSGDSKELAKAQSQQQDFMKKQSTMMKMSFKPLIVTFVPILIVFYWMGQSTAISNVVVSLPSFVYYVLLVPVWHTFYGPPDTMIPYAVGWLGWYILCTFSMSQIIRKIVGLKSGF
jgi:uncharacterized membrane protein (DUF106 family)